VGRGLAHVLDTPVLSDRRRRVDKLRNFFAGSVVSDGVEGERRGVSNDSAGDTLRSVDSAHAGGLGLAAMAELTAEQRLVLVRRRRKLRALLGEDVVVAGGNDSAGAWAADAPPPPVAAAPVDVAANEQQHVRARWRRRKLKAVLGDVPLGVSTLYPSDLADHAGDGSSDGGGSDDARDAQQQRRRQRVRKLRSFFGHSLGADAARRALAPVAEEQSEEAVNTSYEFVPLPSTRTAQKVSADTWRLSVADGQAALAGVDDAQQPFRAQFWVTGDASPETPPKSPAKRASLIARLRPRRPSAASKTPGSPGEPRSPAAAVRRGLFARLADRPAERSPVPPRASSIRPLSPLPPISPNNLQASFDRGVVALRSLDEPKEPQA
ncbi:hypothetical protein LPJ73_008395, partial [Coemansia sp. RSA 2703]